MDQKQCILTENGWSLKHFNLRILLQNSNFYWSPMKIWTVYCSFLLHALVYFSKCKNIIVFDRLSYSYPYPESKRRQHRLRSGIEYNEVIKSR